MTTQVYITDYGGSEAYLGYFESYLWTKVEICAAKSWLFVGILSTGVFSTHVHIMVQKIYFGSLFVAKFYFAFSRKAYFVVTYGSFYGSQLSPGYGSSH
ncbi:hypothetical protein ACSQ6I_07045, partial [Anabaena sp. WFMT]